MTKIDFIRGEMMAAMKAKDKERKNVLSSLLTALKNVQIDKRADLTEEEENQKILKSEYCYGEYFDYLTYRANWSLTVIPNKIFGSQVKVYDILGNDIATLLSSGKLILQGVKQSTLKQMTNEAFEMKNEEKENVVIHKLILLV